MNRKKLILLLIFVLSICFTTKVFGLSMSDLGNPPFSNTPTSPFGSGVKNILIFPLSTTNGENDWTDEYKANIRNLMIYCPNDKCISDSSWPKEKFIDTFILFPGNAWNEIVDTVSGKTGIHTEVGREKYLRYVTYALNKLNAVASKPEVNLTINILLDVAMYDATKMVPDLTSSPSQADIDVVFEYVRDLSIELYNSYNSSSHGKLNLLGFYWGNESIFGGNKCTGTNQYYCELTEEAMKKYNNWVHKKGEFSSRTELGGKAYKTLWAPYPATNAKQINGYTYGFDYVSLQSRHSGRDPFDAERYFSEINTSEYSHLDLTSYDDAILGVSDPPYEVRLRNRYLRLDIATELADRYGVGIETENNYAIYRHTKSYSRLMEWFTWSLDYNNWNQPVNVYYSESLHKISSTINREEHFSDFHRSFYDMTYKYATGKMDKVDVTNYAKGKTYTTSPSPYTNSAGDPYASSVSGNELTDDLFGQDNAGTEWLAFTKTAATAENNGKVTITIDLGQKYNGVYKFIGDFRHLPDSDISRPSKAEVYYSKDGTTWEKFGELSFNHDSGDARYMGFLAGDPVRARYIKFELTPGSNEYMLISELQVYRKKTVTLYERDTVEYTVGETPAITLVNEGGSLVVNSSNNSVATATIGDDGKLHITPLAVGTSTITVRESTNNSYTTLDVVVNPAEVVEVPNTLSGISPLSMTISMLLVFMGLGFVIYAKKNLKAD